MPANFSNMRFKYAPPEADGLELNFSLRSLNFDINQSSIGPNTPFTSELSFELKLEQSNSINSFNALSNAFKDEKDNGFTRGVVIPSAISRVVDKTTFLFRNVIFSYWDRDPANEVNPVFRNQNIALEFIDIKNSNPDEEEDPLFDSSAIQTLIHVLQDSGQKLFEWTWNVKLKFHANWGGDDPSSSAVLFPRLVVDPVLENDESNIELEQTLFELDDSLKNFNDELRLNYEVLYQPGGNTTSVGSSGDVANSIGKASDELTDSISNLANTLNTNLSTTFTTRLQPAGNAVTNDLALWVLIKKGTEALSFPRFEDYMDAIFCSPDHTNALNERDKVRALDRTRSLPFMNIDAYRCVKIASEAFVMVNCMVDGIFTEQDVQELKDRVPLNDGNFDKAKLDEWWETYQKRINFYSIAETSSGELEVIEQYVDTIPYLAVIQKKLKDQDLKLTPFNEAFGHYLGQDPDINKAATTCFGLISEKLRHPCFLELIWSYWHEESMMVQGLNAISRRFQNIKGSNRDPLAHLEIDPLRPLNNLMWGYVQDEQHRLTVRRRAYEYDHHYGISLKGTVTKNMKFADSRSKFIEAFHRLLNLVSRFYNQADDMTVNPDAFPVLNGLREVHLILSEGAHNQYGDLPSTARAEMLMQKWLLSRPEFRQFLAGRTMVAYPETWMQPVATMNHMMGWTQSSPIHFLNLATFGEQLLLSIRFGNWAAINNRAFAANWAYFWREQIQGYIHAYRAVTNVDLSSDATKIDALQPSVHLYRQLQTQQNGNKRIA